MENYIIQKGIKKMAIIYITDEIKEQLEELAEKEHRTVSKEVEYLTTHRLAELRDDTQNN